MIRLKFKTLIAGTGHTDGEAVGAAVVAKPELGGPEHQVFVQQTGFFRS